MRRRPSVVTLILAAAATCAVVQGCGDDKSTTPSGDGKGTISVLLTDAPAAFDRVEVTFSEVAVNTQSDTTGTGWLVIAGEPRTFDLLTLANGMTAVLGEGVLDTGRYGQIRLKITGAQVAVDGVQYPLTVPSGSTSGLKLSGGFTIEEGITTELVVDFDAARSIHTLGRKGDYSLRPVLRLVAKATTGAISGTVSDYQHLPTAYAIAGTDTLASTMVRADTGRFLLGYLPPGSYTVAVTDTLNRAYSQDAVAVTSGKTTDLGNITLE